MRNDELSMPHERTAGVLKQVTFTALVLALAGCATQEPYVFAGGPKDPVIMMTSDYPPENYFSINTQDPEKNSCADFKAAGFRPDYTNYYSWKQKHTGDVTVKAPANQKISIKASYYEHGVNVTYSCNPPGQIFTPQADLTYHVRLKTEGRGCWLAVNSVDASGHLSPVATVTGKNCVP